MGNSNSKKFFTLSNILKGVTFIGVLGVSFGAAYLITPPKVDYKFPTIITPEEEPVEETYFSKLTNSLQAKLDNEEEYIGLKGTIASLAIEYPSNDSLRPNTINGSGELSLLMRNLDNFDFTLDLTIDYNGKDLDVLVGYVNKDLYLGLADFKVKSTLNDTNYIFDYVEDLFFNPDNPNGLGIDSSLDDLIENFDLASLISGGDSDDSESESGGGLNISAISTTEKEVGNNVEITFDLAGFNIGITVEKETLAIVDVNVPKVMIGDVSIEADIDFETITNVLAFDDPNYPKQHGEFVQVISYLPLVDELYDVLSKKQFAANLGVSFAYTDSPDEKVASIESQINVNGADVMDLSTLVYRRYDPNAGVASYLKTEQKPNSTLDDIKADISNAEIGADFVIKDRNDEYVSNFNFAFFDDTAFISMNEDVEGRSVFKGKIEKDRVAELIDNVKGLISDFTGEMGETTDVDISSSELSNALDNLLDLFDVEGIMDALKKEDLSGIIDMIKKISNTDNQIKFELDLSNFGLGDNAVLKATLNTEKSATSRVVSLDVENIELSNLVMDVSLSTRQFDNTNIEKIKANKADYDNLLFANGVINQISEMLNEKAAHMKIDASLLDEDNQGFVIEGEAQFDAINLRGAGALNITQYDDALDNETKSKVHDVKFMLDPNGEDISDSTAYVVYNEKLKAKATISTFEDIVEMISKLTTSEEVVEEEPALQPMLKAAPLMAADVEDTVSNAINIEDIIGLTKKSIIKSIDLSPDETKLTIIIDGSILDCSDIKLEMLLDTVGEEKHFKSIEVTGLKLEDKNLYLKLDLSEYNERYTPVNVNDNFYDFSTLGLLLELGINTTEMKYYNLNASMNLKISTWNALSFNLEAHIVLDEDAGTKIYLKIPSVPFSTLATLSYDYKLTQASKTKVSSELVYEPKEDGSAIIHMARTTNLPREGERVYYFKAEKEAFEDNILEYLLVDMLGIKADKFLGLNIDTSSSKKSNSPMLLAAEPEVEEETTVKKDIAFENILRENGYSYSYNEATGINTWNLGLNLQELIDIDLFDSVDLSLSANDTAFTSARIGTIVASLITVSADVSIINPSLTATDWSSDVEARYNQVINWYNNLPAGDKVIYDQYYFNNPLYIASGAEKPGLRVK